MSIEITMPQLSDTMTEGTLVKWKKAEGDAVKQGEEIADIETDKATMPMEAFEDGKLAWIAVQEGQKVKVGQTLAVLAVADEDPAAVKETALAGHQAKSVEADLPASESPLPPELHSEGATVAAPAQGKSPVAKAPTEPPVTPAPADSPVAPALADSSIPQAEPAAQRVAVSPLAKRLAEELNVDLASVTGSGPSGRIIQRDVEQAAQGKPGASARMPVAPSPAVAPRPVPAAPALPTRVGSGRHEVVPLSKIRSVIAHRLQMSKQNIPHFYEVVDVDCQQVNALRAKLNESLEKQGIRLSIADFLAKALSAALLDHPEMNATFDGQQITRHGDVNLGIAVALADGLIVPVLRSVEQMGLKEIRQRSADLIDRARQQKLRQDELSGATFTISNLGSFGIRQFSAIINPPEVGILAIGSAQQRPVVIDGQIVVRTMMTVCLAADHRVVDGTTAATFLRTFKQLMEEPAMMLA